MTDNLKARLRDMGIHCCNLAVDRIEALEAALTQSRAETAAAYERAAGVLDDHGDGVVTGALGEQLCCSGHMCGCHGADVGSYLQHLIRALSTPDQSAALDAVRAEARAQGMREAAEVAERVEKALRQSYAVTSANAVGEVYCAILAAIKGAKA
jgi:hypothetical protein